MKIKKENYSLIYIILLLFAFLLLKENDLKVKYIRVGYYSYSFKYGGIERVFSVLINHLSKEKYFTFFLITNSGILDGEYSVINKAKRISLYEKKINLYQAIEQEKIDILIYNYEDKEVEKLNKLNKTKVIFYNHSSFLFWIYRKHLYNINDTVYKLYKNCKYVISLIPLENNYLFKKWGIKSILMDNPTTYEFDKVIPSFLTTNNIILLGRGNDPVKRYELPIKAMEFISKEIPDCQMNIVSSININLQNFILKLKLENNVRFTGFSENIEIYLSNASLHILSSLSESYPMALGEVKIFGIPSILCGLDHLALAKGGTIIIYDDNPSTIAYWAIKILKNKDLRKKLGYDARVSMKQRNNEIIAKKWTKLLLSVYYRDEKTYQELLNESNNKITIEQANNILKNQLNLLKKRMPIFKNISFEKFISYSLI